MLIDDVMKRVDKWDIKGKEHEYPSHAEVLNFISCNGMVIDGQSVKNYLYEKVQGSGAIGSYVRGCCKIPHAKRFSNSRIMLI